MIVWYRSAKIRERDVEDREYLASLVASPSTYELVDGLNFGINIGVFSLVFLFFEFNLMAYAIAFILLDFLLSIVDYLVFTYFPYHHPANTEVEAAQKRFQKLLRKHTWLQEKKNNVKYGGWLYEHYSKEYKWLASTIENEEKFISEELEKIKKTKSARKHKKE